MPRLPKGTLQVWTNGYVWVAATSQERAIEVACTKFSVMDAEELAEDEWWTLGPDEELSVHEGRVIYLDNIQTKKASEWAREEGVICEEE